MKKTRKSVIFAVLAVMILSAALAISCTPPIGEALGLRDQPTAPGTGRAILSINSRNASRTILPTALPSNTKYLLRLVGVAGTLSDFYANVTTGTNTSVSNIPVGTYTSAQVIVYEKAAALDSSNFGSYATYAIGESTVISPTGGFTVVASPGAAVSLGTHTTALYTPGTKTGDGTFYYNITKSSTRLSTATFSINPRAGYSFSKGGTVVYGGTTFTYDVAGTPSSAIPTGYYNVVYTLTDTSSNVVNFYQILHVYKNMESRFAFTFTDDLFPAPPATGGATITISVPGLPDDATATLDSDDTTVATVSGTDAIIVTLLKGDTVNLDLTITYTGTIGTFAYRDGSGTTLPLTDAGLVPAEDTASKTISFAIDTTEAPFVDLNKGDNYVLQVEVDNYSLPPIIFKKSY
jgi:hypothetical protein